ncbi:signal peptide peptidase SppA [Desulfurivibrio alkaliphilus]|uniref:Signal peptide peptidase SppA, 36K type n=1 Tax=Desulfurivibrio alkaliphilus (strain DSM 19089 / UNIQEM U267 / AHT2) TaxID=589865 RepID=D6Z3W0_DESAT|nr:signal peptide peptidase SppA [Desulfurivibrio alkaliphilus]ADH86235.1 signal peptide peptidase SppA, 36K type [Desulfurivibrio alkaliphilus AHT 2]
MDEKSSFRRRHPMLSGCLMLLVALLLFWAGVSFLIGSLLSDSPLARTARHPEGVGVIEVRGVISSADQLIEQLTDFRRKDKIKAIVLRIDSPGGAVGASQELFEEVKRTNRVKPVVASMGSVAASGGLYAALGAERIIANPGTLTGSIGVIIKFANLEELLQKIGYRSETIKSGELKDTGAMDRPLTPGEREMLAEMVHAVHRQFVDDVAASRDLPVGQVEAFADGRIFSGARALELQLVDALGNLNDAAMLAASLGGLDGEQVPHLIYPPRRDLSLLTLLLGGRLATRLAPTFEPTPVLAYEWTITP